MVIKLRITPLILFGICLSLLSCNGDKKKPLNWSVTEPSNNEEFTVGDTVTIKANAPDKDGEIKEVHFYVNDVKQSTQNKPPYIYYWDTKDESPGTYLIKTTAILEDDREFSNQVEIKLLSNEPKAQFSASENMITKGTLVEFTDESINKPTSWNWIFEGGEPDISTDQNPQIKYNKEGLFPVTLIVANTNGTDTLIMKDYIEVTKPIIIPKSNTNSANKSSVIKKVIGPKAYFSASETTVDRGTTIVFTDESTNKPSNWKWSFPGGEPSVSIEQNPKVKYKTAGTYNVKLSVSNKSGIDKSEKIDLITVKDTQTPPSIAIASPSNGSNHKLGDLIQFNANVSDIDGTVSKVEWHIDTCVYTNNNTPYSYNWNTINKNLKAGTYLVKAVAFDNEGNSSSDEIKVMLLNRAPKADFSAYNTLIAKGTSVQFTDDSNYSPTKWKWTFEGGEPASSTEKNPKVTYNSVGTYEVSLEVSNDQGSNSCIKKEYITVKEGEPIELFATADAMVKNSSPDGNYGGSKYYYFNILKDGNKICKTYINWDFSSIPENAKILGAFLSLNTLDKNFNNEPVGGKTNIFAVQKVNSSWDEKQITWNNQPSSTCNNQVLVKEAPNDGDYEYQNIDITILVREMLAKTNNTHGIVLQPIDKDIRYNFASSELFLDILKENPKLTILYTMN